MSLTKGVLAVVFALLTAAWSFGFRGLQDPAPPADCPVVEVSCPDASKPGAPVTFAATVAGGDPAVTPTFKWKVSAGKIVSGEGTSAITVDTSGMTGQTLTATVDVGGYPPACTMSASCSLAPLDPPAARKLDEYGDVMVGDEKARLDNFAIELRNDPTARGYLVCYGGRRASRRRCERAKNFLVVSRGMEPRRLVTLDGGQRERLTVEVWVVPSGAQPPQPTPNVTPNESKPAAPARRTRRRPRPHAAS